MNYFCKSLVGCLPGYKSPTIHAAVWHTTVQLGYLDAIVLSGCNWAIWMQLGYLDGSSYTIQYTVGILNKFLFLFLLALKSPIEGVVK